MKILAYDNFLAGVTLESIKPHLQEETNTSVAPRRNDTAEMSANAGNVAWFSRSAFAALVIAGLLISLNCKTRREREAEQAHLDSLYNDSTRKVFNPYKPSNGVDQFNRQREALGDINQYTTPPQPAVPERK